MSENIRDVLSDLIDSYGINILHYKYDYSVRVSPQKNKATVPGPV